MYYEVYIDLLFLINFMMDYLLLLAVRKITSNPSSRWRLVFSALAGSILTCFFIVCPLPAGWKIFFFYLFPNSIMLLAAFKIRSLKEFIRFFFLLYIGGFLLGGIFSFFRQYIRTGSLFFLFAVISYELLGVVWNMIRHMQRFHTYLCRISLQMKDRKVFVNGLLDTGNCLKDPDTGFPVCVVEKEAVKELLPENPYGRFRYITYRSVGKEGGMIALVKFDSMHIYGKRERTIQDVWVGISETKISANGIYEMIVNPDILGGV